MKTPPHPRARTRTGFKETGGERFHKRDMGGEESALQAQGIDRMMLMQAMVLTSIVVVFCWWGFAAYTYWRRDYFKSP